MLVDQSTDEMFVPLNNISAQQKAFLEVRVFNGAYLTAR